jgi:hypothetical protein
MNGIWNYRTKVNKKFTWKEIVDNYGDKEIWLQISQVPSWSWTNKDIKEFYIKYSSEICIENFMTVDEYASFYELKN